MNVAPMSDFDYNSERDILASVLHAADKFCQGGHGDDPHCDQQLAPVLKSISKLEDLNAIRAYPVSTSEDDVDEDDDDEDGDDLEEFGNVHGLVDQISDKVSNLFFFLFVFIVLSFPGHCH